MSEMPSSSSDSAGLPSLEGKVALLICDAGEAARSLAFSLAERGVDVAIFSRDPEYQDLQETRRVVEATGQRCLTFPQASTGEAALPRQVISEIVDTLGRLDIFIDQSSLTDGIAVDHGKEDRTNHTGKNPFFNFDLMTAAMKHIGNND